MKFCELKPDTIFRFDFDRPDTRFIYRVVKILSEGHENIGCQDMVTNYVYTISRDQELEVHILDESKVNTRIKLLSQTY